MLTDHFAILGVHPSATPKEIKAAFRQLTKQHHPDLNLDDVHANDHFRSILEAYATLTQPRLRQAYLEKRWYAHYRNQPLESQPLTLERALRDSIELERFVSSLDTHRMDREGLFQHAQQCIREWQQITLDPADEVPVKQIIRSLIGCAGKLEIEQAASIHETLKG